MMKKKLLINTILALMLTSNLYAMPTECKEVPEGMELAQSLKNKMYDQSKSLMDTFKLKIKNYRDNCDNSQDMFEQTQISILTYKDNLADLKEDLKNSKSIQSTDCTKVPSMQALARAFKLGNKIEIETSYETYKMGRKSYLDQCTLHDAYIGVFEDAASYDDYYDQWKKSLSITT